MASESNRQTTIPNDSGQEVFAPEVRTEEEVRRLFDSVASLFEQYVLTLLQSRCKRLNLNVDISDAKWDVFSRFYGALRRGKLVEVNSENVSREANLIRVRKWLSITIGHFVSELVRKKRNDKITYVDDLDVLQYTVTEPRILMSDIQVAIRQCPLIERSVFQLKQQGWTTAEISEKLGISEQVAREKYRAAKIGLRSKLGPLL